MNPSLPQAESKPAPDMVAVGTQGHSLPELDRSTDIASNTLDNDKEKNGNHEQPAPPTSWTARIQYLALLWSMVVLGWSDGTTGPLLPRIQNVYQVNFTVVSLVFVASCLGSVVGSISNIWTNQRLGFGKLLFIGACLQIVAFAIQSSAPPFPAFAVGYFINGVGGTYQDIQANGFVASYKDKHASTKMGILHAVYGLGATISPIAATKFAQKEHWNFFYLISMSFAVFSAIIMALVFRFKTQEDCLARIGQSPTEESTSDESHYRQIMRLRAVWALAIFILIYVGVEVTIGGWMVTYIIDARHGGSASGYISSGFFGGLTVGRIALLWINRKIGERRAIFLYTILAIGLELIVWLVPSLIGDGVAISLVGVFLGPFFPIAMSQAGRVIPHWLLTGSIGIIAGSGQVGVALLPFITGAISNKAGIRSLHPFLVSMMAVMIVLWALVPNKPRNA